jgi:hypothetical protein
MSPPKDHFTRLLHVRLCRVKCLIRRWFERGLCKGLRFRAARHPGANTCMERTWNCRTPCMHDRHLAPTLKRGEILAANRFHNSCRTVCSRSELYFPLLYARLMTLLLLFNQTLCFSTDVQTDSSSERWHWVVNTRRQISRC